MEIDLPVKSTLQTTWKILVIDDDEDDFFIVREMLKEAKGRKFDVQWAPTYEAGREALYSQHFNAVLVDYDMGPRTGIHLIREVNERGYTAPLILFTGRGSYEVDVEAMQAGATLYLTKSEANPLLLERAIRYAIELKQKEQSLRESEAALRENEARFRALISASTQVLYRMSPDWSEMRQLQGGNFLADTEKPNPNWMAEYIHPDDQPWVQEVIDQAVRTGSVFDLEHRVLRADGTIGWTASRAVPIRNAEGEIVEWFGAESDISERKQAEEEIRKAHERATWLARFPDENPNPGARISEDGTILYNNRASADPQGWGFKVGEKISAPFSPLLAEANKQGKRVEGDVQIRDRFYSITFMPFPDDRYVNLYARDITDRKRTEEALEKSHGELITERNRLLAVMEAIPIGLAIYDENGGVIQANPGFEAIWGSPRPPAHSVNDYDLYKGWWVETGQRVQPEEWAAAQAVQQEKSITGQLIRIQKFDGTEGYVFNSGAPVRDEQGRVIGATVAIMDITKLIEAENALNVSQDRFRVALSSVPLLVYACDRHLRYTWVYNPLRGFRTEDVIGKRDDEIIPYEAASEMISAKQKALDTGQGGVQEVKVPLKGEDTFYILTTDPIRDKQGNITGLTCSAIDITEQKRIQAEQQEQAMQIEVQRRLMDQRERDRSVIARDLHDGPIQILSSTMFHLQTIKDKFQDTTSQAELDQIEMQIKSTIRELRVVMNNLRPPALIKFGFSKVIQHYIEDSRTRFPDLEIALDAEADGKLLSNDTHLTLFRIFQAGINNIIRHSEASKAWVVFKIEQDSFLLELRDNGVGFEPKTDFSQLTRDGHFGLVGMKERAEAIGAEFAVSSERGKGTTLVVKGRLSGKNLKQQMDP